MFHLNRIIMAGCSFAILMLLLPEISLAQQTSGSITQGSTQAEGRIDPAAGQYDGRVMTRSELIEGYIDLGLRQLGGSINGRSGSYDGQVDYGAGVLRGRINGREFVLDAEMIRSQIDQFNRMNRDKSSEEKVIQILGIVNAIVKSSRKNDDQQGDLPGLQKTPEELGAPGEIVPDGDSAEIQNSDEEVKDDPTAGNQKPTAIVPPEPYQPVYITNQTSEKMAFEVKTDKSGWIRVSIDPDDELELDGTQKLKIKYISDTTHTYSLKVGESYRFKSSDGIVKFFSYERKNKPQEPEEQVVKQRKKKQETGSKK